MKSTTVLSETQFHNHFYDKIVVMTDKLKVSEITYYTEACNQNCIIMSYVVITNYNLNHCEQIVLYLCFEVSLLSSCSCHLTQHT